MSEERPLISVIVPVFNVEKYISQCIESILSQSYGNVELLLVNDGSPDKSGDICDNYAAKDSRIRVFHCPNRGVSVARNTGIDNANGQIISFIDPDDFIDSDFIEYLYFLLSTTGSDIAYCSFRRVNEAGNFLSEPKDSDKDHIETFTTKEAVSNCLRARKGFQMFIWNGLFKKGILPRFVEGRTIGQDQDFTIAALLNAKKVVRGWGVRYSYRVRGTGSKSLNLRGRMKYQYLALDDIKQLLESSNADEELINAYYERCFRMDLGLMDRYACGNESDKELFHMLRSRLKSNSSRTYSGIKAKLLNIILSANEPLYRFAFRTIKKLGK